MSNCIKGSEKRLVNFPSYLMRLEPLHYKTSPLFSSLQAMTHKLTLLLLPHSFSWPFSSLSQRTVELFCNITNARISQPLTTPRYLCFSRQRQMIPSFHFYHQMLLEEHIVLCLMVQDRFFNECQNYQSFAKEKKTNKTKHNTKPLKVIFCSFYLESQSR